MGMCMWSSLVPRLSFRAIIPRMTFDPPERSYVELLRGRRERLGTRLHVEGVPDWRMLLLDSGYGLTEEAGQKGSFMTYQTHEETNSRTSVVVALTVKNTSLFLQRSKECSRLLESSLIVADI